MTVRPHVFVADRISKVFPVGQSWLQALWQTRQGLRAVNAVSLEVRQGEVLGIIGESGSGKTTLGFLLADLETLTEGQIRYRARPLEQMDRKERLNFRQKVQVVFQDSSSALNPRRSINAALHDSLRLRGLPADLRPTAAAELLLSVGLSEQYGTRYPHQLSGGQRQRVGIARALAMQPEVLIADEPVSALDVSLQGQIINLLLQLRRKLGLTIVLISHDIAVVKHACDRVAVMYKGDLVELGDVDEVIGNPQHDYTKTLIAAVPTGVPAASADGLGAESGR